MTKTRTRRSSARKIIGIALFLVLLAVSGYGLVATGNFRNPLTAVTQMLGGSGGGEGRTFTGEAPSGDSGARQAPPAGAQAGGEGGSEASISWSQAGGMLFNLWFMAAVSAVIMLIHYPLDFLTHRVKPLFRSATPVRG